MNQTKPIQARQEVRESADQSHLINPPKFPSISVPSNDQEQVKRLTTAPRAKSVLISNREKPSSSGSLATIPEQEERSAQPSREEESPQQSEKITTPSTTEKIPVIDTVLSKKSLL